MKTEEVKEKKRNNIVNLDQTKHNHINHINNIAKEMKTLKESSKEQSNLMKEEMAVRNLQIKQKLKNEERELALKKEKLNVNFDFFYTVEKL